jgi:hypothetical protein
VAAHAVQLCDCGVEIIAQPIDVDQLVKTFHVAEAEYLNSGSA